MGRSWFVRSAVMAVCATALAGATDAQRRELPRLTGRILVSAAASLTDALAEIGKAFEKAHPGTSVRFNFAASGVLMQQIEMGAPVDVFVSASAHEMDELAARKLVVSSTRAVVASNRLVLIAPKDSNLRNWQGLLDRSVRRIAIGNPVTVPAGMYARQALRTMGLWALLQPKIVLAENVRQALTYVEGGNADAGAVFRTDAIHSAHVRIVAEAPPKSHELIAYPACALSASANPSRAAAYVAYLRSTYAQAILKRYGFAPAQP